MNLNAMIAGLDPKVLLALYNGLTGKATSKFASREAGIRQVCGAAKVAGEAEVTRLLKSLGAEATPVAEIPAHRPLALVPVSAGIAAGCGVQFCPGCGIDLDNGLLNFQDQVDHFGSRAAALKMQTHEWYCMGCGHEWGAEMGVDANRSKSVAGSWANPAVAAKRKERHGVVVKDGDNQLSFRSVAEAFKALNLPKSKIIAFRIRLKAAGSLVEFSRHWRIVER